MPARSRGALALALGLAAPLVCLRPWAFLVSRSAGSCDPPVLRRAQPLGAMMDPAEVVEEELPPEQREHANYRAGSVDWRKKKDWSKLTLFPYIPVKNGDTSIGLHERIVSTLQNRAGIVQLLANQDWAFFEILMVLAEHKDMRFDDIQAQIMPRNRNGCFRYNIIIGLGAKQPKHDKSLPLPIRMNRDDSWRGFADYMKDQLLQSEGRSGALESRVQINSARDAAVAMRAMERLRFQTGWDVRIKCWAGRYRDQIMMRIMVPAPENADEAADDGLEEADVPALPAGGGEPGEESDDGESKEDRAELARLLKGSLFPTFVMNGDKAAMTEAIVDMLSVHRINVVEVISPEEKDDLDFVEVLMSLPESLHAVAQLAPMRIDETPRFYIVKNYPLDLKKDAVIVTQVMSTESDDLEVAHQLDNEFYQTDEVMPDGVHVIFQQRRAVSAGLQMLRHLQAFSKRELSFEFREGMDGALALTCVLT